MGSLQTFELNLRHKKKDKSIALKSAQEESLDLEKDVEKDDEDVTPLTKNFNKFFEKDRQILQINSEGNQVSQR